MAFDGRTCYGRVCKKPTHNTKVEISTGDADSRVILSVDEIDGFAPDRLEFLYSKDLKNWTPSSGNVTFKNGRYYTDAGPFESSGFFRNVEASRGER